MEELAYVVPRGIPHGDFLTWSETDQDKALFYMRHTRTVCPGCGTRIEEWDENAGGDRFKYVAEHYICPGCEILEQERENIPQGAKGVKFHLLPREIALANLGERLDA